MYTNDLFAFQVSDEFEDSLQLMGRYKAANQLRLDITRRHIL
jgi:hypothetical protein